MPRSAFAPAPSVSRSFAPHGTRPRSGARSMQLSDIGELGLLAELERRGLARGIANDAAQLGDGVVVTQDVLVEGVHFRREWISWRDLGWRAAAVNLSDLAASGADADGLIDISDGVAVEAAHIAARSGCRVVVELERVPRTEGARIDDLGFGEDFELLAAVAEP